MCRSLKEVYMRTFLQLWGLAIVSISYVLLWNIHDNSPVFLTLISESNSAKLEDYK